MISGGVIELLALDCSETIELYVESLRKDFSQTLS